MKRNTMLMVGFIVILLLVVLRAFVSPRSPVSQLARTPIEVPPAPIMGMQQPKAVSFSFATAPNLPRFLPVYHYTDYSQQELEESVLNILSTYDIQSSSVSSLLRAGVYTKTWEREGANIAINTGGITTITFHQSGAVKTPTSKQGAASVSKQFISNLVSFPDSVLLSPAGVTTDVSEGLIITDALGSSSYEGDMFSYLINGYPIVTDHYAQSASTVVIDNLGIVRSATMLPPPKTVLESEQVALLSAQDILTNLAQQKGAIVSAGRASASDLSGEIKFSSFVINRTSLVYSRNNGALFPALLLQGAGKTSGGNLQEAEFFLWASAQQGPSSTSALQ